MREKPGAPRSETNFLSELHALNVDLFLKTQGIDTTTPSRKAMCRMLSVFADFERSIIQERVRAGLVADS
jgi:DNA invertase Pin-like site-specific DNA recombinase